MLIHLNESRLTLTAQKEQQETSYKSQLCILCTQPQLVFTSNNFLSVTCRALVNLPYFHTINFQTFFSSHCHSPWSLLFFSVKSNSSFSSLTLSQSKSKPCFFWTAFFSFVSDFLSNWGNTLKIAYHHYSMFIQKLWSVP